MLFMLLNFSSSVWAAKIYLNTNEVNDINWGKDNAWFFAHIWSDGGSSSNVKMTSAGNGYYSCDVPDDKNKIIFVRKNPRNSELNFNNKWGQTKDLTIPTDGNNLFTPNGWDNCDGTWSTYEEEDLPDALPDAVLCGKKNVLFFEDFGTLDGEQNRKQNNQIDGQNFYTSYNYIAECAKINGDVHSEGTVKIGQSSVIIGNIYGKNAVIAGAVKGDIDVQGPVVLDTSAIVMGNIKSKSVQINNGAVVEGLCSQCYADVSPTSFFDEYKG